MSTHPLLLVTGLSGAGKTQVMKGLEDLGFFCIDNLPPSFLPLLAGLRARAMEDDQRIAVAIDVRSQQLFEKIAPALDDLDAAGVAYQILFLDCADDVLVRRYAESRRRHPMKKGHSLYEHIEAERRLLAGLRGRADLHLDTSRGTLAENKGILSRLVLGVEALERIDVDFVSFGFKHGVPLDADLMFDLRFLPNPFYLPELKALTGLDAPVAEYVLAHPEAKRFLDDIEPLLERWIELFNDSGKPRLTVAIGCTGGQHRSVALAEELSRRLAARIERVQALHRDVTKAKGA
jgi:UPF0042 nucleotide-binding protein